MFHIIRRLSRFLVTLLVILALLATAFFLIFDKNLRQIINDYASSVASSQINRMVNQEIYRYLSENPVNYQDLVSISYGEDAVVRSLSLNSIAVDKIKSGSIAAIETAIRQKEHFTISVPIGTIIGNEFTVNRGPAISMDMTMSPVVKSDLVSRFESAGINQTLHKIDLELTVDIYIVLPWYRSNATVKSNYILAETVIVGEVPNAYTMVIESETDNTAGLINDYGAENYQ